ncbi:MAG: pyruvate kinase [Desulfobacterales bacterium]|uniref:Pyruvate kinase n=1 Tax=Candidatus Desulfatibia vada TaxID=2841696 RepID=A0A8J6NRH5_9BACT|nr:pyruvate kinase [Candidatus Desulfatibia vada]MBL6971555.1 pyruvate kinase [Desulfobacterales bacterium]
MRIDTDLKLLIYRRTKIVATLGPSSNDSRTIERLITTGINVFRLNMSHGTHDEHSDTYQRIRTAAHKLEKPIAVLADLCGPKIRVGTFHNGRIELVTGNSVTVTSRDVIGRPELIPSQYEALADDVEVGNRILLDDGNIELLVQGVEGTEITCKVVSGGVLSDHKGMNLPGVNISSPTLTEKDRVDAHFALQLGVDFLALSFVRRGSDVEELRALISATNSHVAIVAKIEKPEALDNIDEIMKAADAIMVARGDLGVELPPQVVPNAQNQLIDLARTHRKPVIVATQMLESMIDHPRPTRAEVSDVANAVRSGADAVMLSAETALGKYPVETVKMMDDIARQTEAYLWRQGAFGSLTRNHEAARPFPIEDALSESMAQLSRDLLARAIMIISIQGRSLEVMSSSRPAAPMIGICPDYKSSCIASLLWGVIPVTADPAEIDNPNLLAKRIVKELGLTVEGQTILVVRGFSRDAKQNTPSVTIVTL